MFNTLNEQIKRSQGRVFSVTERVMRSLGLGTPGMTTLLLACLLLAMMLLE